MTLPITISDSDFTVGAVSTAPLAKIATRLAEAVINTAWSEGISMKNEVSAKIDDMVATGGVLDSTTAPEITVDAISVPTISAPSVSIPSTIDTATIIATYADQYAEIVALLKTELSSFRTTFFPDESAAYAAAEDWLQAAIADPSGLPSTVRAQLLSDDLSRITADASRASDAAIATFAARRFPLPPGAAAAAIVDIQRKAQEEVAASSRKITIASIEQMKFNIQQVVQMRQDAMSAAFDYLKTLVSGPEIASRLVGTGYDAQSRLIGAAADFYRADASAKGTISSIQQFNAGQSLEAKIKNQAAEMTIINSKIETMLTEIKAVAQMATGMMNNLHANAGLSVSV